MNNVFIIASLGFALWEIRNVFFWVKLWQGREYRLDRTRVQLLETAEGRSLIFSPVSGIKWMLIVGYIAVIFQDPLTVYYQYAICGLYVFEGVVVLHEVFTYHQFKRPVRTVKAYAIILLSLLLIATLYILPVTDIYLWLVLLDRITVIIVAIFVFFFSFPTEIYTDYIIQKAKKKLSNHKKLLVIAVSGSYGKSSTKEYIAQVLSSSFTVVKTSGSNNTPIGIAKTILHRITNDTEIFVVEMGAYKKGEIAELCDIVRPHISVTTSVSDQHLSLYGSLKNAIDTEVELIQALPRNGLALFNGNNSYSMQLYKKTKKKKVLYKVSESKDASVDILACDIAVKKDHVSVSIYMNGKRWGVTVPLIGGHMIENILPAIYIARHLGMKQEKVKQALHTLMPPAKTMIRKMLPHAITEIDDTFNASPESVFAVLDYMKIYKTKKFLVLTPLIELGKNTRVRHISIGEGIGHVCNYVFLTNANFSQDILEGVTREKNVCEVIIEKRPDITARKLFQKLRKGDIVVFEGKEAAFVKQSLEKLYKEETDELSTNEKGS